MWEAIEASGIKGVKGQISAAVQQKSKGVLESGPNNDCLVGGHGASPKILPI